VSKAFIKSLRGLEHKAWKFFIYDEASADEVAKQLGISNRTSFRLKDSIKSKAKRYLKRYYAGNYNFN
jgi:DNA-directed RNA polymerase specialized sigma subunit